MKNEKLRKLFIEDLRDLYDAEKQLVKALPKLAAAATHPQVQSGIREHTLITRKQVERIEKVFDLLEERPRAKPCKGMQGLIAEGDEHMGQGLPENVADTAIIGSGQKIEHYEIAGYQSAVELADLLGETQASRLLQQTLREEERMSKKLTQISGRLLKESAKNMEREEKTRAA